ncbi:hypothetical protein [uncultured Duncaniella sp.]|uniref:hypothetical protein n=1 Tax=uncultured Duncaniella sp. TaxID=2768039 RepID=UPI002711FCA2|nr:hypothetical protein [uncultured Duncaniella sp.]
MGWKKLIMGDKMPDKNDPKYKERYEKEVSAGRKVARLLRIDKAAAATQRFADRWPRLFLGLVFGIVIFCFMLNVYRLSQVATKANDYQTAVEKQESMYKERRQSQPQIKPINNNANEPTTEY